MNLEIFLHMLKKVLKKLFEDIKDIKFNFIMICLIHKILVLLKITRILKHFLRSIIEFYFLKDNYFFSQHIMIESSNFEEENIIKDVRNCLDGKN